RTSGVSPFPTSSCMPAVSAPESHDIKSLPLLFFFVCKRCGPYRIAGLRPEDGEALVRVEDVRLDIVDDLGLALQFGHRAAERHPVEEFLLPGILDRRGRQAPPTIELARGELVEAGAVAGIVGIE